MMNQHKYWLALHHTPYIGPVKCRQLLEIIDRPEELFNNYKQLKSQINFHAKTIQYLNNPNWEKVEKELQWAEAENNHIITITDPEYPVLLKEISDAPALLYVSGNKKLLQSSQLAIVGSRNPGHSGQENAFNFARYLSKQGLTITSGLALGIDADAHKGALASKGNTVAVVATGLDRVYPARNRDLAHEIIANGGAIVSEYPLGTSPKKEFFPRRNRIISGMSLGTLVVEAALQSGSLITARLAAEQGRDVFAIPGSIHNPLAKGCHSLIREGAKLVEKAEHILEELDQINYVVSEMQNENQLSNRINIEPEYAALLEFIGFEPTSIDTIVQRSGLTPEAVSSMLLVLELQEYITSLPGGVYSRLQ